MSTLAHTVERSVVVRRPAEEVREALRDERFVSEWLGEDVELREEDDGANGDRVWFRWEREGWGESVVELSVDAVAAGARVTVVESGFWPATAPSLLGTAWGGRLRALPLQLGRLVAA